MKNLEIFYVRNPLAEREGDADLELLKECGHHISCVVSDSEQAIKTLREMKNPPELVVLDICEMGDEGFAVAQKVANTGEFPIIILIDNEMMIQECFAQLDSDRFGYIVRPLTKEVTQSILTFKYQGFVKAQTMKKDYDKLVKSMKERKIIERAKGIVMRMNNCTEDEAMKKLQKRSSELNVKMADLAREVVDLGDRLKF